MAYIYLSQAATAALLTVTKTLIMALLEQLIIVILDKMQYRRALLVVSALGPLSFLSHNRLRTHMAFRVVLVVLVLWVLSLASSFLSTLYFFSVPGVVGYDERNVSAIASGCHADMFAGLDHGTGCSALTARLQSVFDLTTTTAEGRALQWRASADAPSPLKPSFEESLFFGGGLARVYPSSAVAGPGAFVTDVTNLEWGGVSGQAPTSALSVAHWFDEYGRPGTAERVVLVHAPAAANESYLAVTTAAGASTSSHDPVRGPLNYLAIGNNGLWFQQSFCTLGTYRNRKFLYMAVKPKTSDFGKMSTFLASARNVTRSTRMVLAPVFASSEFPWTELPKRVINQVAWPASVKDLTRFRQGLCTLSEVSARVELNVTAAELSPNVTMQPYTLQWENGMTDTDVNLRPAVIETYATVPYTTQYYRRQPSAVVGQDVTTVRMAIDRAAAGVGEFPLVAVPSWLAGATATLAYPVDGLFVAIVGMFVVGSVLAWYSPALRFQDVVVPRLVAHGHAPIAPLSKDDFERDGFIVWESPTKPDEFGLVSARDAGANGEGEQPLMVDGANGLAEWSIVRKRIQAASVVKS
ncbi:hypothetical protein GGF32_004787 [Allomyces javanicus]|nr:hypothetical protein GGF32_004787 [Allomyces javanicus]